VLKNSIYSAAQKLKIGVFESSHSEPSKMHELTFAEVVLQGSKKPHVRFAFGKLCIPAHPLGTAMVSSEGACAAFYHYGRIGAHHQLVIKK